MSFRSEVQPFVRLLTRSVTVVLEHAGCLHMPESQSSSGPIIDTLLLVAASGMIPWMLKQLAAGEAASDVMVDWHEEERLDEGILKKTRSARRTESCTTRRTHWAETTPRFAATAANWRKRETSIVLRKDVLVAAKMVVGRKKRRACHCDLNVRLVED